MRRFYIDKDGIHGNSVIIKGEQAHHIKDVIRLRCGDRLLGFDGTGKVYTLRIKKADSIIDADIEQVSKERLDMPKVLLACALPRREKMDYIIEKTTELGVSEIMPLITERTVVKIDNKNRVLKKKRWEKIIIETSKQCCRDTFTKIYDITPYKEAIEMVGSYKRKLIACLSEDTEYIGGILKNEIDDVAVFIGPEGDFSKEEIDYAETHGFEAVSLGPFVLKVDTASIFVISVIQEILMLQD